MKDELIKYQEVVRHIDSADQELWKAINAMGNSDVTHLGLMINDMLHVVGDLQCDFVFPMYTKHPSLSEYLATLRKQRKEEENHGHDSMEEDDAENKNKNLEEIMHIYASIGYMGLGTPGVNTISLFGKYPINMAVSRGSIHEIAVLLENGAKINVHDTQRGYTPLHTAVENDNLDVVKFLLENGASLTGTNYDSETPVDLAKKRLGLRKGTIDDNAAFNKKKNIRNEIYNFLCGYAQPSQQS